MYCKVFIPVIGINQLINYCGRKKVAGIKGLDIQSIPLNQKRCLTVEEFQAYMGIGRNNALRIIKKSGCGKKVGRKILVDRIAFDGWLEVASEAIL